MGYDIGNQITIVRVADITAVIRDNMWLLYKHQLSERDDVACKLYYL